MKISSGDAQPTSGLDRTAGTGSSGASSVPQQPAGQEAASDRVQLSGLSRYLVAALAGSPEHVAKVNQLSDAVSSDQYQADAYLVSGSIIQHSIEFGGASYLAVKT